MLKLATALEPSKKGLFVVALHSSEKKGEDQEVRGSFSGVPKSRRQNLRRVPRMRRAPEEDMFFWAGNDM